MELLVKRFSNRKLYVPHEGYITMKKLITYVRSGAEVKVVNHKTGEDITKEILLRAVLELKDSLSLEQIVELLKGDGFIDDEPLKEERLDVEEELVTEEEINEKAKVMFIDDEKDMLEIYTYMFSDVYEVLTHDNAQDALNDPEVLSCDVVAIDLGMPHNGGLMAAKALQHTNNVLIVSGFPRTEVERSLQKECIHDVEIVEKVNIFSHIRKNLNTFKK